MYLRILKKDLKRKKSMNVILLVFIIFATTFIASSANNMVSVLTALDNFFEKSGVPDYWVCLSEGEAAAERFRQFAGKNDYNFKEQKLLQADPKNIKINGRQFEYTNTTVLATLKNSTKIFDQNDREITNVNDGEIYLTGEMINSYKEKLVPGDTIQITIGEKTKSFTLAGKTKDAMFGSSMMGMTKFLISEKDLEFFHSESTIFIYSMCIYTEDAHFMDQFIKLKLNTVFNVNYNGIKNTYIMNMVMAAAMLIISICLILISMLCLRFTIHFTMSEEFREIGVMKAIGIEPQKIRGLYIIKYFTISCIGGTIGLFLSIPFSKLMNGNLSQNIIMADSQLYWLNLFCAFGVAAIVVMFCYFCTRKVKNISPIHAIRNGENGERYSRKGLLHLSRSGISPIPFLAVNDIFSEIRKFVVMILTFITGTLLIIIPINTINTLQSDKLLNWFSMATCDHVIGAEEIFNSNNNNHEIVTETLNDISTKLAENNIKADVFKEVLFRTYISHNEKEMASLAFQGLGDITTDRYVYLEGTPPQNNEEVGISHIVAENIGANIGDTVEITNGRTSKKYIVTALFQTMNNMGEGIRFYQDENLDYSNVFGSFGTQIKYTDDPDKDELARRKNVLKDLFPDAKIYTAGEYINDMIGDIAGSLQGLKYLVVILVLCINILVTVLMVKSFITKEKGEIAILKAMGFKNSLLVIWQTLRIGIILFLSIIVGVLLGSPLSKVSSGQVFKIMGAQSIEFEIIPLEIYVLYPLIVLAVTILASMLAALQVRKISVSETSNIE